MAKVWRHLQLPHVHQNPFSIRPLSAEDSNLFVGRQEMLSMFKQFILRKSSRQILLVGPYGSGRSSLVQCLEPIVSLSAYIDHLNATHPGHSLLQSVFSQFFESEPPQTRSEVTSALVNASFSSDRAPLIVLDFQSGDTSTLHVALRDTLGVLERTQALVIMICDQRQRQLLPVELAQPFEEFTMPRFTQNDVIQLVATRLESVGHPHFELSVDAANEVLEVTDGYPRSILQLLRNHVDEQHRESGREMAYKPIQSEFDARPELRNEPDMLHKFRGTFQEEIEEMHIEEVESSNEPVPDNIIDASMPWHERDSFIGPQDNQLFDLDLEELKQDIEDDEPLLASPAVGSFAHEIPDDPPRVFTGAFKSLRSRNISALEEEKNVTNEERVLESDEEFVLTTSISAPLQNEDDEQNIFDHQGMENEFNIQDDDVFDQVEPQSVQPSIEHSNEISTLIGLLQGLIQTNQEKDAVLPAHVIEMLSRHHMPKLGHRNEYPLNGMALQRLSSTEIYVVTIASKRMFSPSDEEMLRHLNIRRSRLSQIANSLLKAGILTSRMVGRKSMYTLTNNARAQLVVWSNAEGGAAE